MEDTDHIDIWLNDTEIDMIIYTLKKSDSHYKEISRDIIEHIFNKLV